MVWLKAKNNLAWGNRPMKKYQGNSIFALKGQYN